MTVPANISPISSYTGNNSVGTYAFGFRAILPTDVKVQVISPANVVYDLQLGADYTQVMVPFPNLGGSITLIANGEAYLTGDKLKTGYVINVMYNVIARQLTRFRDMNEFSKLEYEKALDKLTMDVLALKYQLNATLQLPPSEDPDFDPTFPPLAGHQDEILIVNPTATGFDYGPTVNTIEGWKTDAQTAASAAAGSASTAATAATNAGTSATNAAASANAATTAANNAGQHEVDAEAARDAAVMSAINAEMSAINADLSADLAKDFAEQAEAVVNAILFTQIVNLTFANSPYNINAIADDGKLFIIDTAGGNFVVNLPTRPANFASFNVGFVKEDPSTNKITVNPFGADLINGVAAPVDIDLQSYGKVFTPGIISTDWKARIFIVEGATGGGSSGAYAIQANQVIANGGKIVPTTGQQWLKISSAADIDLADDLFTATLPGGTVAIIENTGAFTIKVPMTNTAWGFIGNGDIYLGPYGTLTLMSDDIDSRYKQIGGNGL